MIRRKPVVDAPSWSASDFRRDFSFFCLTLLDWSDSTSAPHSVAVGQYACDIAAALGCSPYEQELARISGYVHDLGKLVLSRSVLAKSTSLTRDERGMVQKHSEVGAQLLASAGEAFDEVAPLVRHHHERFDGEGYPDGLAGEEIPLLSRVLCVAEAYSWMVMDVGYRAAYDDDHARHELVRGAGAQFDPRVVEAFTRLLAEGDEDYRLARGRRFVEVESE